MNLSMIANLAGVSVSTASKAFAGSREISEETRERIFQIARENGCFDKYIKNKYEKKVIAVIYPELRGGFYTDVLSILDELIYKRGGIMISSVCNFSAEREKELYTYYSAYAKVDGIIVVGMHDAINNSINIPLVAMLSSVKCPHADTISSQLVNSIEEAVTYLKKLGHTRIGFAGESLTKSKQEAYKKAMHRAGMVVHPSDVKVSAKRFEEAGMEVMEEWLAQKNMPSAVLAAYDHIAIGLIKCARNHGMHIPEDLSVIGMDDIPIVPFMDTSISSINMHIQEACNLAVDVIFKKMENQYYAMRDDVIIKSQLIIRDSVGNAKH